MGKFTPLLVALTYAAVAASVSITDIQGISWQSPFVGQTVNNLTGIVSAKVSTLSLNCPSDLTVNRVPADSIC